MALALFCAGPRALLGVLAVGIAFLVRGWHPIDSFLSFWMGGHGPPASESSQSNCNCELVTKAARLAPLAQSLTSHPSLLTSQSLETKAQDLWSISHTSFLLGAAAGFASWRHSAARIMRFAPRAQPGFISPIPIAQDICA